VLPFVFAAPGAMFGISPWAICVVAGAWVGIYFAERRARALHFDIELFRAALTWIVASGFVLGHVIDEVFYHPDFLFEHPTSAFHLLNGQSSCGGFLGALAGGYLWKHVDVRRRGVLLSFVRRPRPLALLPYAEVITSTFPVTWVFARLGCALVHDHPGRLARASWFTLAWPTGPDDGMPHAFGPLRYVYGSTSRYDLGLLECLFTIVLALALAATWRKRLPLGFYACAVCFAYAPVRFGLDFLRVTGVPEADPRYATFTFAQWFCVAMFASGVLIAARMRAGKMEPSEETMAPLLA
jgi:phosphatidylglycerol---prolipoprotein diacylglyceryl transferase